MPVPLRRSRYQGVMQEEESRIMNEKINASKVNSIGIRSRKILAMMLTTGVISSLLSIGATLYVTKENTIASKEIEESKQKNEFYVIKFKLLTEYRLEIQSALSHITNEDLVHLDGNDVKAKSLINKINNAMRDLGNILTRMAPLLDQDIKDQLAVQKKDLVNLNKEILEKAGVSKNENEIKALIIKYVKNGIAFILNMKNMTDEQLSRISSNLN